MLTWANILMAKSINKSNILKCKSKKRKETEILVETNFRSFVFVLPFKKLLLVKLFDIRPKVFKIQSEPLFRVCLQPGA